MNTAIDINPAHLVPDVDMDDDLIHLVCGCDLNIALCGAKVPGACWIADGCDVERDCVVCLDLDDKPCERCGV